MKKKKTMARPETQTEADYDFDCSVCQERAKGCANAAEGKLCGRFVSRDFDPAGRDPVALYEQTVRKTFDAKKKKKGET